MGHECDVRGDDSSSLDGLVTAVIETRRRIAALQAHESRLLAGAVDLALARMAQRHALRRSTDHDLPVREIAAELGAAMRLSDRTVQSRMGDATTLVERFPATLSSWEAGEVDAAHVAAIVESGAGIGDDEARVRFEARALELARCETPARLRPALRAIAAAIDPEAESDPRRGHGARRVRVIDLSDGMARLAADLPAVLAHAVLDRLTRMGRDVLRNPVGPGEPAAPHEPDGLDLGECGGGDDGTPPALRTGPSCAPDAAGDRDDDSRADSRTMDQLRADILADLLLAGAPAGHGDGDALSAIEGRVQVTVPALTLAGVGPEPALLSGYGPIDAATARILAGAAPGWDRVFADPLSGAVLAVDRYRPGDRLRRLLAARDEHCRFPGCRMPARRCDLDHTEDAALGGPTTAGNLGHLCRRHHTLKHATTWSVRQLGRGVIEWRSPIGRRYQDHPPAMVRFVPAPPGPERPAPARSRDDPPPF